MFKDVYKFAVGKENAAKYQTVGFAVSSACAEFIADIALCPFEAVSRPAQDWRVSTPLEQPRNLKILINRSALG